VPSFRPPRVLFAHSSPPAASFGALDRHPTTPEAFRLIRGFLPPAVSFLHGTLED